MSTFKASVQYGDWNGTSAADNADQNDLSHHLTVTGLMTDSETLIASSVWVGENHGGKLGGVTVTAYLFSAPGGTTVDVALDAITGPIPVREVELDVTLEQFIGFFKRFKVYHTHPHLNLEGREYTIV
jgi:hypothetical protein